MSTELFANNYSTQLATGILATDTTITVTTSPPTALTGAGQFRILVDQEYMIVTAVSGGGNQTWTVSRGQESTTAAVHQAGSWVTHLLTAGAIGNLPSTGLSNPMTTAGDLIIGGVGGAPTRLAASTSTYVLTSNGPGAAPSWQAGGAGGLSGSTTASGAEAGSYGRSSTIAAPVLRDFVSILDFVPAGDPNSNGNGTTDDSSVVQAAYNALEGVGGGTLYFTTLCLDGVTQATWTYTTINCTTATNMTVVMYGSQHQITTGGVSGAAMWKMSASSANPGTYQIVNVKFFGGDVLGKGSETTSQSFIQVARGKDITIRDVRVIGWGASSAGGGAPIYTFSCQRVRIEDCTLLNCCENGGQNPITISISSSFQGQTVVHGEIIVTGNIVQGTGAVAVGLSYDNSTANPALILYVVGSPTSGQTQVKFNWGGTTYTSLAITPGMTAAQIQTAIQGSTGGSLPASCVTVYAETNVAENTSATLPGVWGNANGVVLNPVYFYVYFNGLSGTTLMSNLSVVDAWVGGSTPQTFWQFPKLRIIITGNDLETTGAAGVGLESGGSNTVVAAIPVLGVIVAGNHVRNTGSYGGGGFGIAIENDGAIGTASNYLFQYCNVSDNIIEANGTALRSDASNSLIRGNIINVLSGNNGIMLGQAAQAGGTAQPYPQRVRIEGGQINMSDSSYASGSCGIAMYSCTDCAVDGIDINWPTGTVGTGYGILLFNQTGGPSCTGITIRATIANAPSRAIWVSGGDCTIQGGTKIINPSSNTTTAGIRIDGTLTSNIVVDPGVHINDNRGGGAKMNYAIDCSSATLNGFGVYLLGSQKLTGWTSAALNGTFATKGRGSVWDTTGVTYDEGLRRTYVNASPSTGTWGRGDWAMNTGPGAAGTAIWVCTTAGSPGTWTPLNFAGTAAAQNGIVAKSANYTLVTTDSGAKATTGGITITLPTTGLGSSVAPLAYIVKNAAASSITVSTGTTGKIDNFTGGNNATTYTVSAGAAGVFVLDTNFADWILS